MWVGCPAARDEARDMTSSTAPHPLHPDRAADPERAIRYGDAVAWTLVAAFTLSVVHTIYAWRTGLEDPDFTVDTPLTWVFYGVAFAVAALARRTSALAQGVVLAFLVAVLAVSVFYYPTTFTEEKQTTFGWFENDVYVGLLVLALFLSVARLLRRPLVP
jgi:uncharacterized membrane protein